MAWLNPHSTVANGWSNPNHAKDGDTGTKVEYDVSARSWSTYLELHLTTAIQCNKIQYYATRESSDISSVDIDIYDAEGGTRTDVYQGSPTVGGWKGCSFNEQTVKWARIRFYNDRLFGARKAYVHAFQFFESGVMESASANLALSSTASSAATATRGTSVSLVLAPAASKSYGFHRTVIGIAAETTHYFRAKIFANNSWYFSDEKNFTTLPAHHYCYPASSSLGIAPIALRSIIVSRISNAALGLFSVGERIQKALRTTSSFLGLVPQASLTIGKLKQALGYLALAPSTLRNAATSRKANANLTLHGIGHLYYNLKTYIKEAICHLGLLAKAKFAGPGRQLFLKLTAVKAKTLVAKVWDRFTPK